MILQVVKHRCQKCSYSKHKHVFLSGIANICALFFLMFCMTARDSNFSEAF